ncbi:hypothetical protein [Methylorubrum aminovorans]
MTVTVVGRAPPYDAYVRQCLDHIASMTDQTYEDMAGDWRTASGAYDLLKAELARQECERAAWRAVLERDHIDPLWRRLVDAHLDGEARKAARPALGKPLSRRARRRNRGRVWQAGAALRKAHLEPVLWEWRRAPRETYPNG